MILYLALSLQQAAAVERQAHRPLLRVVEMVVLVAVERTLPVQPEQVPVTPQALHRLKAATAAQALLVRRFAALAAAAHLLLEPMAEQVPAMVETVLRLLSPVRL
jgi:hypothetical protein